MRKSSIYSLILIMSVMGCSVPLLMKSDENKLAKSTDLTGANPDTNIVPWYVSSAGPDASGNYPAGYGPSGLNTIGSIIPGTLPSVANSPFTGEFSPKPIVYITPYPFPTATGSIPEPKLIYNDKPVPINGKTYAFNPLADAYTILGDVDMLIGGNAAKSLSSGYYASSQQFGQTIAISACKDGYFASTVDNVIPGDSRDVHLYPLNEEPAYSESLLTVKGKVTITATETNYTKVVFSDTNNSISSTSNIDKDGNYSITVRPPSGKSSVIGTVMAYTTQTVGGLTQIDKYAFKPYWDASSSTAVPLTLSSNSSTWPLAFGDINYKFNIPSDLSSAVIHVYMTLPTGDEFFVGKYVDTSGSSLIQGSIKIPRVNGASYTVQAHCGTSDTGSDIIIPQAKIGDTVEYTFLSAPVVSAPSYNGSVGSSFAWGAVSGAVNYQLELTPMDRSVKFGWEAYTPSTSLSYPAFTTAAGQIKSGQKYYMEVMATDFGFNSFNVLSLLDIFKPSSDKLVPRVKHYMDKTANIPGFKLMMADPTRTTYPTNYRVSYKTVPCSN